MALRDKVGTNGYLTPMSRADWVSGMLIVVVLLASASAYFTFREINLLERILEGEQISEDEALSNGKRIMFISRLWIGAYIVTAVVFSSGYIELVRI